MKTQKFNKKLLLNKRTITNLGNSEMDVIFGGNSGTCACASILFKCPLTYYACWSLFETCDLDCTIQ